MKEGSVTTMLPTIGRTVQMIAIVKMPSIRLPPRTAYTTSPKKDTNSKIPTTYSMSILLKKAYNIYSIYDELSSYLLSVYDM